MFTGISRYGLSNSFKSPRNSAKNYIDRYFERYPGVKAWIDHILVEAREQGSVRDAAGANSLLTGNPVEEQRRTGVRRAYGDEHPDSGNQRRHYQLAMLHLQAAHQKNEWMGACWSRCMTNCFLKFRLPSCHRHKNESSTSWSRHTPCPSPWW